MALAQVPNQSDARTRALDIVTRLETAMYELDHLVRQNAQDPDILAAAADASGECEATMKQVHADAQRLLLDWMGRKKQYTLASGDVIVKTPSVKVAFDDGRVRHALADIVLQHSFSPKTGEIKLNPEFATEVVELVLAVMGKSKPKTQALKAHRIDPTTLQIKTPGEPVLELRRAEKVSQGVVTMVRGGGAK